MMTNAQTYSKTNGQDTTGIIRPALTLFIVFSLITGLAYPMLTTVLAQGMFPEQANGSLIRDARGHLIGSTLIGQPFNKPEHFWSRPSATGPNAYNAAASSGSNLGPLNPALTDAIQGRIKTLQAADPGNKLPIPADLVTTSASGLDPHISLAAAKYQLSRVARSRGMPEQKVRTYLEAYTEQPWLGFIGEARVNVLQLNLALDGLTH